MTASGASNINRLWADLIVEELIRCGVDFFCLAPGSRSTPLITAVAAHPKARHVMHYDERGTAFFALGYGRAARRPAVWITTSGTALANGYPAVVEASVDAVPMLLLTADRPPELRDTGANQTIKQADFYGGYVRWFFDLPAPTTDIDPAMALTTVDQAVQRARRGPVHLNGMFREPLAPTPDGRTYDDYLAPLAPWRQSGQPYTRYAAPGPAAAIEAIADLGASLRGVERGLVVAGRLDTRQEGDAALRLAERLGWPLLPDVGSQVRLGREGGAAHRIGPYDLMLGSAAFREAHPPSAVLHVGGRPTSRRLAQWLARCRPRPYVVVSDKPVRLDPDHRVTHRFEDRVDAFCNALSGFLDEGTGSPSAWLSSWKEASCRADRALTDFFARRERVDEPAVARLVSQTIPDGQAVVLASSMPVRDVDRFAALDGPSVPVAANRGASGIDGLVATAAGFAEGLAAPVTLLIGDLALLHDLNSLALIRERPVVVVAVNNDGGGIFHFLPIADHGEVFEPFFGTPHGLTFEAAARLFGLAYLRPQTPAAFKEAYRAACGRSTGTLLEVTTDRTANRDLHRQIQEAVDAALERAWR